MTYSILCGVQIDLYIHVWYSRSKTNWIETHSTVKSVYFSLRTSINSHKVPLYSIKSFQTRCITLTSPPAPDRIFWWQLIKNCRKSSFILAVLMLRAWNGVRAETTWYIINCKLSPSIFLVFPFLRLFQYLLYQYMSLFVLACSLSRSILWCYIVCSLYVLFFAPIHIIFVFTRLPVVISFH